MSFVVWEDRFNTGIASVDEQHKILIEIINELYDACCIEKDIVDEVFRSSVKKTVDYVVFHFAFEEKLQITSQYPDHVSHKKKHDEFIRNIINSVEDYKSGKRFVPNKFMRYLIDWLLEHIAVSDKTFGAYYNKMTS
jgi:hemerythrin